MAKCNRETHPDLFAYLDAYGLDEKIISRIDRIKGNSESAYYVVGWKNDDGSIGLLDISNTPDRMMNDREKSDHKWSILNDGFGSDITEKDWNKIKIDPYCETFIIPGHEEYGD